MSFEKIKQLKKKLTSTFGTINTTIKQSQSDFQQVLRTTFDPPPTEELVSALHHRFRRFKISQAGEDIEKKAEMEILDFLIALNLLTRHSNSQKLKLLFELCDDDNDGCMRPAEIL